MLYTFNISYLYLFSKLRKRKPLIFKGYVQNNGASDQNRTGILALARPCTNHCTTPASQINYIIKKEK